MSAILLHNPRCSKSRAALALLEERGLDHTVRNYLDEPLSLDELRILKKRLKRPVTEWVRWSQNEASGMDRESTDMDLMRAIAAQPILMERPILIRGDEALVGRPGPEALEPLL